MKIAGLETGQFTQGRLIMVAVLTATLIFVLISNGNGEQTEEPVAAPPLAEAAVQTSTATIPRASDRETTVPRDDWRSSSDRSRAGRRPLDGDLLETMLGRDPFVREPEVVSVPPGAVEIVEVQEPTPAADEETSTLPDSGPYRPVVSRPRVVRPQFIAVAADGVASFVLDGRIYHVGDVLEDGSVVRSISVAGIETSRSRPLAQ